MGGLRKLIPALLAAVVLADDPSLLDARIELSRPAGSVEANSAGVFYRDGQGTLLGGEKTVYPPESWGTSQLYYFGEPVSVKVTVANKSKDASVKRKVRVELEGRVVLSDGGRGPELFPPRSTEWELGPGSVKKWEPSIRVKWPPALPEGLYRFSVRILSPSLVKAREGAFCPPKFKKP